LIEVFSSSGYARFGQSNGGEMRRRAFLISTIAAGATAFFAPRPAFAKGDAAPDWTPLERQLGDRLLDVRSPLVTAAKNPAGADALFAKIQNPYYLGDEPALTQTLGWIDAWTSRPSLKAVAAASARDVAAALTFARRTGVPPVVKGGGHSYLGNSNRAGSILIWTRRLRTIEMHDAFRPQGAPADADGVPAVSVGAGCLWGEVYRKVSVEHGRYVQGGGCLTVGVAGFVQGGGFGSLSKQFGTGAANLLEAEIVTADGRVRTVNRWQNPDLYFALRGGGGGTFGVVTRLTLKTHPLPSTVGAVIFEVRAKDEASWRALTGEIIDFYAEHLFGPRWGEQIRFSPGRRLGIAMLTHTYSQEEIVTAWAPFLDWVKARSDVYTIKDNPLLITVPGRAFWDPEQLLKLPGVVLQDDRQGAPADHVYWASNKDEAAQVLNSYQSAWLPNALLEKSQRPRLAEALARAGKIWSITLHVNKGLGGGSEEALTATRETATNPEVLDAFALVICAAEQKPAWPGIKGHEPKVAAGRAEAADVTGAMREMYALAPNAGAYMSECDYFLKDWKRAQWGDHYHRLAAAKRRYDPSWLFRGHHIVEPS
jgi:FAD/FMN-containing dehydrogenase